MRPLRFHSLFDRNELDLYAQLRFRNSQDRCERTLRFVSVHRLQREGREADSYIFRTLRSGCAVLYPLASMSDDCLARMNLDYLAF